MTARPLLVVGTVALAAGAIVAAFPAVLARSLVAALAVWVAATLAGLLTFYGPAFVRNRRGAHPYRAADAAVAAGALAAGVLLALGTWRAAVDPGVAPLGAFVPLPLLVAGAAYVLPRQAKRPLHPALAWAAVAGATVAASVVATRAFLVALAGAVPAVLVLLVLVVRAARAPGAQARASWPLFATGAVLMGGSLALILVEGSPALAGAFLVGEGLLLLALTYALAPVVMNAVPLDRSLTWWIAAGAFVGAALLVVAWRIPGPWLAAGRWVLAGAALLHVANVARMARPRRDCPPDLVAP